MKKSLALILILILPLTGCIKEKEVKVSSSQEEWKNYEEVKEKLNESYAILYFYSKEQCSACEKLEENVFSSNDFIEKAKDFLLIKVDVDSSDGGQLAYKYGIQYIPYLPTVIFLLNGTELFRVVGITTLNEFLQKMDDALKGKMGDDFPFVLLDGTVKHLSDYRGKPVIVDFMATWCQPCHMQMKELSKVKEHFGNNIYIISLDIYEGDDANKIKNTFGEYVNKWIFGMDEYKVASKYVLEGGIPTLAIFDSHGRWKYVKTGYTSSQTLIDVVNAIE